MRVRHAHVAPTRCRQFKVGHEFIFDSIFPTSSLSDRISNTNFGHIKYSVHARTLGIIYSSSQLGYLTALQPQSSWQELNNRFATLYATSSFEANRD
eukprot:148998-Pleurochrysis_carterae.AAC.1